jgi:hypothetical protein
VEPPLSDEHFSGDDTLIEAWALAKSFRPEDGSGGDDTDFHGARAQRTTRAPASRIRTAACIARRTGEAKLSYMGHVTMETGTDSPPPAWSPKPMVRLNGALRRQCCKPSARRRDTASRHAGYGMSQSRRAMIECIFGWGKQHGTMRKSKHRGLVRVAGDFLLNHLIRLPRLPPHRRICPDGGTCRLVSVPSGNKP